MIVYKCKMCGGNLNIQEGEKTAVCEYCGTQQTVPSTDDEKKANLFNRANHFRRNSEFDKAKEIYEHILDEDSNDAEVYWSIVLCKYGIEYVEDPVTGERKPTINRVQPLSILQDADYKMTLEHANFIQKSLYEKEAVEIDEIQKEILNIANNESPYDIFISYKEKAMDGGRTQSSVLAQNIYQMLTKEGYRVFFSRISLEDKLGQKYEPYIYSALNSAKVMLVVGTEKEEFNAPWVKNEWARFLNMMQENTQKVLIPCFRNIDPYDLPDEFQMLQSQDMAKVGADQDLLHGIEKIVKTQEENKNSEQTAVANSQSLQRLLQNAETYIQLGNYEDAQKVYQKITELYPEDYRGWMGRVRAVTHDFSGSECGKCEIGEINKWIGYVRKLTSKEKYEKEMKAYLPFMKKISKSRIYEETNRVDTIIQKHNEKIANIKKELNQVQNDIQAEKMRVDHKVGQLNDSIKDCQMDYFECIKILKSFNQYLYVIVFGLLGLSLLIGGMKICSSYLLSVGGLASIGLGIVSFGITLYEYKRVKLDKKNTVEKAEEDKELIEKNKQQISMYQEEYTERTAQLLKKREEIEKRIQNVKDEIKECEAYKKLPEDELTEVIFAFDCGKIGILMEINPELKEYRQKIFSGGNVDDDSMQMKDV